MFEMEHRKNEKYPNNFICEAIVKILNKKILKASDIVVASCMKTALNDKDKFEFSSDSPEDILARIVCHLYCGDTT